MAITRIRTGLDDALLVQTLVKRGYRLAYEPERVGACTDHTVSPGLSRSDPREDRSRTPYCGGVRGPRFAVVTRYRA